MGGKSGVEELIQVLLMFMFMFMLIHVPSSTRGNRALRGESECDIALSTYLHLPSNLIQALVNALDPYFLSFFLYFDGQSFLPLQYVHQVVGAFGGDVT